MEQVQASDGSIRRAARVAGCAVKRASLKPAIIVAVSKSDGLKFGIGRRSQTAANRSQVDRALRGQKAERTLRLMARSVSVTAVRRFREAMASDAAANRHLGLTRRCNRRHPHANTGDQGFTREQIG
jgi:hypothetical protein